MKIIENNNIKEKLYIYKLENGLEILIMPKKDFKQKTVMFGTKFGSINNEFKIDGEKISVPDGIAHFLEHKVFEQENGEDALMQLASLGANPNAYTTADHTVYYFDTIDNFEECMKILFEFVQSPYFTDENVEKEKGIIGQEIQMYDDNPEFQIYITLLQNLYVNHPIRIDTAGTIKSISEIDKDLLYKCYNTFYNISNMLVCVCGDINPEEIVSSIEKLVPKNIKSEKIEKVFPVEPKNINQYITTKNMSLNTPLFSIGFKDNYIKEKAPKQRIKFDIATQIALELLVGKSSKLHEVLYNTGLVTEELEKSYNYEADYGFAMVEGYSNKPKEVIDLFIEKIENVDKNISLEDFERIRKMLKGEFAFEFNNVPRIARMIFADYIKGINTFDYFDMYEEVTFEDLKEVFDKLINKENMAISIIEGKDE